MNNCRKTNVLVAVLCHYQSKTSSSRAQLALCCFSSHAIKSSHFLWNWGKWKGQRFIDIDHSIILLRVCSTKAENVSLSSDLFRPPICCYFHFLARISESSPLNSFDRTKEKFRFWRFCIKTCVKLVSHPHEWTDDLLICHQATDNPRQGYIVYQDLNLY